MIARSDIVSPAAKPRQLDLFGLIVSTEQQRQVDALTCLRDAMPEALQIVVELRRWQVTDSRAPHAAGGWAYCASRAGLRWENADEWWGTRTPGKPSGWDRTPANLMPWTELASLIGDDPRRAEVTAWMYSIPEPRWRPLMRPHELWPEPERWHTSYFCRDHVDKHWTARRHAWQLVLDLLTDAIDSVPRADHALPAAPEPPAVGEELSADRRRTIRQAGLLAVGTHPLSAALRHHIGLHPAAAPHDDRTAPGRRCGNCRFRRQASGEHQGRFPKCSFGATHTTWPRHTNGAGTDVRAWWPACPDHEWGDQQLGPDAARWVPGEMD